MEERQDKQANISEPTRKWELAKKWICANKWLFITAGVTVATALVSVAACKASSNRALEQGYRWGFNDGYGQGYEEGAISGHDEGYAEGLGDGMEIGASAVQPLMMKQTTSPVSQHIRSLPEGQHRSAAKDEEILSLGLTVPDTHTLVDQHQRTTTTVVAA